MVEVPATTTSNEEGNDGNATGNSSERAQGWSVEFLHAIGKQHVGTINAVRFSPDDKAIFLWFVPETKEGSNQPSPAPSSAWNTLREDSPLARRWLRGHQADVYDLAWSPDSRFLLSGSVDNVAIVWDAQRGRELHRLRDHSQYIQGVTWDPAGLLLATQSTDSTVRVYSLPPSYSSSPSADQAEKCFSAADSVAAATREEFGGAPGKAKARKPRKAAPVCRHILKFRDVGGSGQEPAEDEAPAAATGGGEAAAASGGGVTKGKQRSSRRRRLFHRETLASFFRRLTFTPDGSLLLCPAGQDRTLAELEPGADGSLRSDLTVSDAKSALQRHMQQQQQQQKKKKGEEEEEEEGGGEGAGTTEGEDHQGSLVSVTHVFARGHWEAPVAILPSGPTASVAVRCAKKLFRLRRPTADTPEGGRPEFGRAFHFPYRMLWAVATLDSVMVYDSEQPTPIAVIRGIHYERLTDVTWSHDARVLMVSSMDGYCTAIAFGPGELGEPLQTADLPAGMQRNKESRSSAGATEEPGSSVTSSVAHLAAAAAPNKDHPVHNETGGAGETKEGEEAQEEGGGGGAAAASVADPTTTSEARSRPEVDGDASEPQTKRRRIAPTLVSSVPTWGPSKL